jgi:hypothetical protein
MFTRAEVTYAWPRADGTVGSDREPVALFTGEAVHACLGHLPDEAIEAMFNELAVELGAALGQERIYVAFADPHMDLGRRRTGAVTNRAGRMKRAGRRPPITVTTKAPTSGEMHDDPLRIDGRPSQPCSPSEQDFIALNLGARRFGAFSSNQRP